MTGKLKRNVEDYDTGKIVRQSAPEMHGFVPVNVCVSLGVPKITRNWAIYSNYVAARW